MFHWRNVLLELDTKLIIFMASFFTLNAILGAVAHSLEKKKVEENEENL